MKAYIAFYLLLMGLLHTGCKSKLAVYDLQPVDKAGTWYQGLSYVELEGSYVDLHIAYDRTWFSYLVYNIEIQNISDSTFTINPEQFYYYYSPIELSGSTHLPEKHRILAVNPEAQLLEIDSNLRNLDRTSLGEVALLSALSTSSILLTQQLTNQVVVDNFNSFGYPSFNTYYGIPEYLTNRNATLTHLNQQRGYWGMQALRKTTLFPGERISGLVFFPLKDVSRYNYLHFPIYRDTFSLVYQQIPYR